MSTTQILVLIVVLLLLLFAISRYFTKQDYRSKGGAPFILYKSDIEKIYNAIYDNSISLKDYGLDNDDKANIKIAFKDIEKTIIESRRNLGILTKSLHSWKNKNEQLKSLKQRVSESHNKRLADNTLKAWKKYHATQQNKKTSDNSEETVKINEQSQNIDISSNTPNDLRQLMARPYRHPTDNIPNDLKHQDIIERIKSLQQQFSKLPNSYIIDNTPNGSEQQAIDERIKSLEQRVSKLPNSYITDNIPNVLRQQNINERIKSIQQQFRISKETNIINKAKEGIEYESRECHIHKHKVVDKSSSELSRLPLLDHQNDKLVLENNRTEELEKTEEILGENPPTINPIEQQTEKTENERSVNEERANEEDGIAEVSKNETIINDDNNGEQNNQSIQQNNEEPMNIDDKQQNNEEPMNTVDEQQNNEEPDLLGGRGLSIYNYGFLEAYIHFKRIEGIKLEKIKTQMNKDILRIQCYENYILDIIPVKQQFDVPFDWRRKEHIKKTSICTSFDIYRAKDRANVEWCIYKDVYGQTDFTTYLYRLQNPNPVSYESISVNDDSSDTDM